jgi:hypothetical protein
MLDELMLKQVLIDESGFMRLVDFGLAVQTAATAQNAMYRTVFRRTAARVRAHATFALRRRSVSVWLVTWD